VPATSDRALQSAWPAQESRRQSPTIADRVLCLRLCRTLARGITAAEIKVAAKADTVFLAVPWSAYADAVAGLGPWGGRIVVDAMNAASVGSEGFRPAELGGRRPANSWPIDSPALEWSRRSTHCRPQLSRATPTLMAASGCYLFGRRRVGEARSRATHRTARVRGHRPRRRRDGPPTPAISGRSARRINMVQFP